MKVKILPCDHGTAPHVHLDYGGTPPCQNCGKSTDYNRKPEDQFDEMPTGSPKPNSDISADSHESSDLGNLNFAPNSSMSPSPQRYLNRQDKSWLQVFDEPSEKQEINVTTREVPSQIRVSEKKGASSTGEKKGANLTAASAETRKPSASTFQAAGNLDIPLPSKPLDLDNPKAQGWITNPTPNGTSKRQDTQQEGETTVNSAAKTMFKSLDETEAALNYARESKDISLFDACHLAHIRCLNKKCVWYIP